MKVPVDNPVRRIERYRSRLEIGKIIIPNYRAGGIMLASIGGALSSICTRTLCEWILVLFQLCGAPQEYSPKREMFLCLSLAQRVLWLGLACRLKNGRKQQEYSFSQARAGLQKL